MEWHLATFLSNPLFGIGLESALHEVSPLSIANATATLSSFREHCRYDNCIKSLSTTGWYEAAGVLWWFKHKYHKPSWRGEEIKGDCTYQQYLSAKALFTDAALKASSETEALQRLAFPVYLASAIGDLSEIHQKAKGDEGMWVQDMPLIAGSPFVLGFCGCLQEALENRQ